MYISLWDLRRCNPRVLRELADVIAKPLSMIFERSWQSGEVPGAWEKGNVESWLDERGHSLVPLSNPGSDPEVSLGSG